MSNVVKIDDAKKDKRALYNLERDRLTEEIAALVSEQAKKTGLGNIAFDFLRRNSKEDRNIVIFYCLANNGDSVKAEIRFGDDGFLGEGYLRSPSGRACVTVCDVRGLRYETILRSQTYKRGNGKLLNTEAVAKRVIRALSVELQVSMDRSNRDAQRDRDNKLLARLRKLAPSLVKLEVKNGLVTVTVGQIDEETAECVLLRVADALEE